MVQNATRNAKYNDSIEQGHSFLLTSAEIEALLRNSSKSLGIFAKDILCEGHFKITVDEEKQTT